MKRLTVLAIIALLITGCAGMNLPANSTPEQIKAARCMDAQTGLAIATVALAKPQTPEGKVYWDRYLEAVQVAITAYCM
jgi:hypothetical protein